MPLSIENRAGLVAMLGTVFEMAKAGKIDAAAIAFVSEQGEPSALHTYTDHGMALLGTLTLLQSDIAKGFVGRAEPVVPPHAARHGARAQ